MFDAEHFDGFKDNKKYALSCLKAACMKNGAKWIILCDTNGGLLQMKYQIITELLNLFLENLGIHAHNDTENAVSGNYPAILAELDRYKA